MLMCINNQKSRLTSFFGYRFLGDAQLDEKVDESIGYYKISKFLGILPAAWIAESHRHNQSQLKLRRVD